VAVVVDVKPLEGVESIRSTGFSLSELGYEEQVVYGTLPQENTFDFFLPLGWQTTEQPYFVLKFAHAEIISGESVLDVSLNGIPVGSTLLNVDNAREGELLISLPSHLLRSGRNQLTTGVEMAIADIDPCAGAGNKRAWTVINSESEISLPYQTINLPADLSLLPYPFSQPIGFDDTVFVLPDQTSDQLLEQLTQIAIQLGSATTTDSIVVETQYASEAVPADLTGKHLIVIGRPSANNLIAQINHDLPQPFIPDTDILQPLIVDSVAFLPDLSRDAGLIELLSSPWSKDDTILAITGTTDEGVVLAIQAITDSGLRLSGNLAVVEPTSAGLDEEQAQISSYSIDTRATQVVEDEAETTSKTEIEPSSERILISLASRWWK
jgi:hypothetical protein